MVSFQLAASFTLRSSLPLAAVPALEAHLICPEPSRLNPGLGRMNRGHVLFDGLNPSALMGHTAVCSSRRVAPNRHVSRLRSLIPLPHTHPDTTQKNGSMAPAITACHLPARSGGIDLAGLIGPRS